jgi:hypothetical protein
MKYVFKEAALMHVDLKIVVLMQNVRQIIMWLLVNVCQVTLEKVLTKDVKSVRQLLLP